MTPVLFHKINTSSVFLMKSYDLPMESLQLGDTHEHIMWESWSHSHSCIEKFRDTSKNIIYIIWVWGGKRFPFLLLKLFSFAGKPPKKSLLYLE